MAGIKRPDSEVSDFALYYREYRRKKKAGEPMRGRGRPRITDESKLSQKPHAVYMRNYMRKKKDNK